MYIETKNLVKTFSGRNVVDGVSLRVDKGASRWAPRSLMGQGKLHHSI